ncbi:uncharacterized protein LOC135138904 [Zophobas morio]|uniref:uncharacterized protein LOC135138904 n=1 Tax=Zophobas morio TaxID=2755281 RepID=UPI003083D7E3
MTSFVVFVVTLATFAASLKLPSNFKKCDLRRTNFNECLGDAIHDAIIQLDKPIKSHGLESLYDVQLRPDIDVMNIGNHSQSVLRQKFSKFRIVGLSKPEATTARLDYDHKIYTLTLAVTYPELLFPTEYAAEGSITVLPTNVVTPVEVTLENPTLTYTFKLKPYQKDTTYLKVIDTGIDVQVHGMRWNFKQLFRNKRLNEEFNSELTEHGQEVFATYKYLEVTFAPYFGLMLDNLLAKVPLSELFDGI